MWKRLLAVVLLLALLGSGWLWWSEGVAPGDAVAAMRVAAGMGAKLGCSSRYLSGFDAQTIEEDLATYSDSMRWLRYRDLPRAGVEASLFGVSATARYRPGLGCTLEFGHNDLDAVQVPVMLPDDTLSWPRGRAPGAPDVEVQALLERIMLADNRAGEKTRALLVARDGRLLAEVYAPGITRDTPLLGWSMGKSVIAVMVGRLEAMGLIDRHEADLFPPWRGDGRSAITIENLLHMSSGLDFVEDYVPGSDSTRMLFMSPAAAAVPLAKPLVHPPGSHFYYSSGTTNLLSRLVFARVGGTPQAQVDFFHRELVVPMALENTVLEPDAAGVVVGSSFVYASARDWARFGQLMLNGGELNGQRLLDADWAARASVPNDSANDGRYGYQFWLNRGGAEPWWPSLPPDAYALQGNRSQVVMIVPSHRAVLVRLGWSSGQYPIDDNFARILAALQD